jgi:GDP-4-dehydro-6-deoxy-D-mannose reductase
VKVLITGVAGFVGGHMTEFLGAEEPQVEVWGLDRPMGAALTGLPAGARGLPVDLEDPDAVTAAIAQVEPDRVIHLAGQSSVGSSWTDPGATLRTNVLGLVHVLDALVKRSLSTRVLVVGSAEEYGLASAEEPPFRETDPLRPNSPYAVSKAAQGLLALEYAAPDGLSVVLTRTFPHTGPRRGEAFAESSFARQIVEIETGRRQPVLEVGNLDAVRDFSDVRDVVRAYWALLNHGESGQAYNVCCGSGVRIRDMLQKLIDLSGVAVEVRVDPKKLRPSDIPVLVGNNEKLRQATSWTPRFPLEATLADLLQYWRER